MQMKIFFLLEWLHNYSGAGRGSVSISTTLSSSSVSQISFVFLDLFVGDLEYTGFLAGSAVESNEERDSKFAFIWAAGTRC